MSEDIDSDYFDEFGPSQQFCNALEGNRDSALKMWRQVADGKWDIEAKLWCQEIAKRLLAEDNPPSAKRKPDAIQKAVGLAGKKNTHEKIDEICMFHALVKNLDAPEAGRKEMMEAINNEIISKNILTEDKDIEKIVQARLTVLRKIYSNLTPF